MGQNLPVPRGCPEFPKFPSWGEGRRVTGDRGFHPSRCDFIIAFGIPYASAWQRFRRDIRLLYWLAKMFVLYFPVGGPIRRAYRRKKRAGEPFYID